MSVFIYIYILIFIFGLVIGSFLNVCIYRIPRGESISYPPSHCTNCDNKIKWYDLIPVLSYIFLGGRCRHCKSRISIRYPLMELFTAMIFTALFFRYDLSFTFVKYIILSSFIIVISLIDFDTTDVYTVTTVPGIIIGLVLIFVGRYFYDMSLTTYFMGAFAIALPIALIAYLTGAMGTGDVEICALCGLFLGMNLSVFMIFVSVVLGGIIGAGLILLKLKSRKDYIPFGPFIGMATVITMLFGQPLIQIYMKLLSLS